MSTNSNDVKHSNGIVRPQSSGVDEKVSPPTHLELSDTLVDDNPSNGRKIGGISVNARMSPEERATALRLAHELDPGPSAFSWTYTKFCLTALVVILNSGDSGKTVFSYSGIVADLKVMIPQS